VSLLTIWFERFWLNYIYLLVFKFYLNPWDHLQANLLLGHIVHHTSYELWGLREPHLRLLTHVFSLV
uniref:Uncharacterized protein n=1 Tax=Mustela putorius furo TaxID=9669 RepID=M3XNG2_MUSPF